LLGSQENCSTEEFEIKKTHVTIEGIYQYYGTACAVSRNYSSSSRALGLDQGYPDEYERGAMIFPQLKCFNIGIYDALSSEQK
jgi:hypothetical protein